MGQITSLFVRKVLGAVDDDVDKDGFLRSLGIDPDSAVDPRQMVSDAMYYDFLERLAAVEPEPVTISLRAGAAMRCDDYGALGLAWKSATDLRGSYERAVRYARVLTSVSTYEVEPTEGGAFMHLRREGERRLGLRLSNEATIASIASISEEASTGEFKPNAVYFKHAAPDTVVAHEKHFGCPVHFGADRDALLVSHTMLKTPNRLGDATIARFFDSHLEAEVAKLEQENSLGQQVLLQVSRFLSEGIPTVSDIAKRLGMSARTLQRRLAEQSFSFQSLVDEARRQLAERLLRDTEYSLAEVAFMTGFSEQSAFNRAFKRWAGQTPRSFRINPQ